MYVNMLQNIINKYVHYINMLQNIISFNMGSASKMGVASNRCTAKRNRTTINKDKDQRVYIGRLVVGHIIIDGLLGISPGI